MKREIKFRAWDGEKMLSPDYIDRKGVAYWRENSIPERSEKIMQYTGLKDKNGAEIYEGDVIIKTATENSYVSAPFVVQWLEKQAGFNVAKGDHHYYEIIGNIYENPELLKAS